MFQLSDQNAGTTYDLGINGASFTTNLKWIKKYLAQWLVKMIGQNYLQNYFVPDVAFSYSK